MLLCLFLFPLLEEVARHQELNVHVLRRKRLRLLEHFQRIVVLAFPKIDRGQAEHRFRGLRMFPEDFLVSLDRFMVALLPSGQSRQPDLRIQILRPGGEHFAPELLGMGVTASIGFRCRLSAKLFEVLSLRAQELRPRKSEGNGNSEKPLAVACANHGTEGFTGGYRPKAEGPRAHWKSISSIDRDLPADNAQATRRVASG